MIHSTTHLIPLRPFQSFQRGRFAERGASLRLRKFPLGIARAWLPPPRESGEGNTKATDRHEYQRYCGQPNHSAKRPGEGIGDAVATDRSR